MSFAAVFLYEVDTAGHEAFQSVYGSDGDLLIDRWRQRGDCEAFSRGTPTSTRAATRTPAACGATSRISAASTPLDARGTPA
jgi:hypothetical protein